MIAGSAETAQAYEAFAFGSDDALIYASLDLK